jgi:hypothetical protein
MEQSYSKVHYLPRTKNSISKTKYCCTNKKNDPYSQKKETLYSISKQWNVSISDLKQWNGLINDNIRTGQKLTVYIINNSVRAEQPAENKAEQPAENKAEQPVENKAKQPAENKAEQPAENTAEQSAENTAEQQVDNDDEPAVKPLITFLTKQRILFFGDSMI